MSISLSDIAVRPLVDSHEAVAITLGIAAVLTDDLCSVRRPALDQIWLTDAGEIRFGACDQPVAVGDEARWLAGIATALLGLDETDERARAIIPGGLLVLLARAMGRTSLPPLGFEQLLDGLQRFGTADAQMLKAVHDRYQQESLAPAEASWAPVADPEDPPLARLDDQALDALQDRHLAGPTVLDDDSSPPLHWSPPIERHDAASGAEPLLFTSMAAPERRSRSPRLSPFVATAATAALVMAIIWLPQLTAETPPAAVADASPAAVVGTGMRESPTAETTTAPDPVVDEPPLRTTESSPSADAGESLRANAPRADAFNAIPPVPAMGVSAAAAPVLDGSAASEPVMRSPDGTRLAFLRTEPADGDVPNLWIADVRTGARRRLTNHTSGYPAGVSWFPDGTRIAYGMADTLVIADVRDGQSRRVKSPVQGRPVRTSAVSPDGARIAVYISGDGDWTYDLHSGEFTRGVDDNRSEE